MEVRKDGKFLDERCTVIDIFKTGLSSQVKIRCKEKKQKVYTLSSLVTVINYRGDFMEEKILEFIRVDDVPQGCKDLVEIFGMDTFIRK